MNNPMRILHIEDDDIYSLYMKEALSCSSEAFTLDSARDGRSGLKMLVDAELAGKPYDIALLDIKMPVLDGHQVLSNFREKHPESSTEFIVMTGSALQSDYLRMMDQGVKNYIEKGLDLDALLKTVLHSGSN